MGELKDDILKSWVIWLRDNISEISNRCYIENIDLDLTSKTKPFITVNSISSNPLSDTAYEKVATDFLILIKVFNDTSVNADTIPPKVERLINNTEISVYTYSGATQGSKLSDEIWWATGCIDISTREPHDRVYRYACMISCDHIASGLRIKGSQHYS